MGLGSLDAKAGYMYQKEGCSLGTVTIAPRNIQHVAIEV